MSLRIQRKGVVKLVKPGNSKGAALVGLMYSILSLQGKGVTILNLERASTRTGVDVVRIKNGSSIPSFLAK